MAYLPLGLDAAVNWGTTDFQFRNNFHFPVKIEAETTEDLVKMRILGTDEKDYYIEMTSGYDDSREDVIYAVSYKNKYSKGNRRADQQRPGGFLHLLPECRIEANCLPRQLVYRTSLPLPLPWERVASATRTERVY